MSEAERMPLAIRLEVEKAYAERARQAGLLAMAQLSPQLTQCVTYEQYAAWWEDVEALTQKIISTPH